MMAAVEVVEVGPLLNPGLEAKEVDVPGRKEEDRDESADFFCSLACLSFSTFSNLSVPDVD